jgi:hypothetical protein
MVAGKRVGHGFVVGRQSLLEALGMTNALAVRIGEHYVGRAGLVQYLKYVKGAGSTVRIVPSRRGICFDSGSVGGVDLAPWQWIPGSKRELAESDAVYLEVGQNGEYAPNIGPAEFAKALTRVLTVMDRDPYYPAKNEMVIAADGLRLTISGTDLERAAEARVPCITEPARVKLTYDEAKAAIRILQKATRARVEFRPVWHEVRSNGATTKVQLTQMVVYGGPVKLECTPVGDFVHPLSQGVAGARGFHGSYRAFAFVGARELADLVRAAEVVAMDPDYKKGNRLMYLAVRSGQVEVTVVQGNDLVLATSLEAETTGEGDALLDARLVLPVLRVLDRGTIDLGIPKVNQAVMFSTEEVRFWVFPIKREVQAAPAPTRPVPTGPETGPEPEEEPEESWDEEIAEAEIAEEEIAEVA